MPTLPLTPEELLTTTRAVRKRLDLTRPVEREVIEECLTLAQQAPSGGNLQPWHFVVVTAPEKRAALGELWRRGAEIYMAQPRALPNLTFDDPERRAQQERIWSSAVYLYEHVHEVPVHVVPCLSGRTDDAPIVRQAAMWGSILPATWSFMLAARARGLGTCWTTFHLHCEREAADVLGIPFEQVMQAALIPVARSKGTAFSPARREPLERMVHWDAW